MIKFEKASNEGENIFDVHYAQVQKKLKETYDRGHYGLRHPENKMTKIAKLASSGPIGLKTQTKCQLSSLNG